MQALGRPGQPLPQRVLVAGCGTGAEAFVLRKRLPQAEIVGVDFSPRSVAVAQRLLRAVDWGKPITFLVGDLTDRKLAARLGEGFDLITCHGVASYVPRPGRVLETLGRCLRPRGALYLGVNGEAHPATRLRPWLERFGVDVGELSDERRLRELLGLWDALYDDGIGELAHMSASYLASDICGSFFNNWPLSRWRAEAARAGWRLTGSWLLPLTLRLMLENGSARLLHPLAIDELADRLDAARPASFHQLVFQRAAGRSAAEGTPAPENSRWQWTGLYALRPGPGRGGLQVRGTRRGSMSLILSSRTFKFEFLATLKTRQAEWVRHWVDTPGAREFSSTDWGLDVQSQETLWLWSGLGVVAPSN